MLQSNLGRVKRIAHTKTLPPLPGTDCSRVVRQEADEGMPRCSAEGSSCVTIFIEPIANDALLAAGNGQAPRSLRRIGQRHEEIKRGVFAMHICAGSPACLPRCCICRSRLTHSHLPYRMSCSSCRTRSARCSWSCTRSQVHAHCLQCDACGCVFAHVSMPMSSRSRGLQTGCFFVTVCREGQTAGSARVH